MSDKAIKVGACNDCLSESLQKIVEKVHPIVGYMMNVVIFPDEDKDQVRVFVATKTAKEDIEMLLPDDITDRVSVEVAPDISNK